MHNTESVKLTVKLGATFWKKLPEYSIHINDQLLKQDIVDETGVAILEFNLTLPEQEHILSIKLHNKDDLDVVQENDQIVKDMLLNIEDILVDDISLEHLIRQGRYVLDRPQQYQGQTITELANCVNLGWNGCYELRFSTPFYMWLLENL